jgi:hypothetical protein
MNHDEIGLLTPAHIGNINRAYRKTYAFEGDFVDENQRRIACLSVDFPRGKPPFPFDYSTNVPTPHFPKILIDLIKIYELAYFAAGNVIDLGTAEGRSSYVMSQALTASGNPNRVHTIELSPKQIARARKNHAGFEHCSNVIFHQGSGHVVLKELIHEGVSADFVFVDHSHEFEETALTCSLLDLIIPVGGMALFHDYLDGRNFDPDNLEYNVVKGIGAGLDLTRFRPVGVFGSTGLFERIR